jgi:hypothetical protein
MATRKPTERALLIAHFTMMGWQPMSGIGKGPLGKTVLVNENGHMCKLGVKTPAPSYMIPGVHKVADHKSRTPRQWPITKVLLVMKERTDKFARDGIVKVSIKGTVELRTIAVEQR